MDMKKQRDILKWMLGQAFRAEKHERQLKKRLAEIRLEMEAPYGAIRYDAMPRAQGNGDGAAALVLKLAEVEERIVDQMKNVVAAKMHVMDIIELIPINAVERQIFELRHIDMMNMFEIAEAIPMSRQNCHRLYNATLDVLLQTPEIQEKVRRSEPEYDSWVCGRARAKK